MKKINYKNELNKNDILNIMVIGVYFLRIHKIKEDLMNGYKDMINLLKYNQHNL